jgi:hypothetical protein
MAAPDPVGFARTRLGFEPDAVQARVLMSEAKRGILNCGRQWGKSTTAASKAVFCAYTNPGSLVLVASPTSRQSAEFVLKAAKMLRKLKIAPRGDGHNECSLLFPNGSRIVGLPGVEETLRGFSAVSLILIDEASIVSDDLYEALNPMLAVGGGSLWMMSTPRGKSGFFYSTWEHGGKEWERVSVKATECPRISKEFLESERSRMGEVLFRREYMCEFSDRGAGVFDRDLIERALTETVRPMNLGWRLSNWAEPKGKK